VVCPLDEDRYEDEFFKDYEEIQIDGLKLFVDESTWNNERHSNCVLGHPDLTYRLSPYYSGSVLRYLQRTFNEAHIFADKKKPMPFMVRAKGLKERYEGPAFMIAPVIPGTCQKK